MAKQEKCWFAVYTKPRWEKKVHRSLAQLGFESYCPLNKVRKKWSDRMKIVEEPLFKSYVFVHIEDMLRPEIRFVDGVLNFVYWNKKPAIIKDEEIVEIKKFLSEYDDVEVKTIEVRPADEVMVNSGVMMGAKGRVLRVMGNNMVEVRIESLGFILTAKFDKKAIAKV